MLKNLLCPKIIKTVNTNEGFLRTGLSVNTYVNIFLFNNSSKVLELKWEIKVKFLNLAVQVYV